MNRRTLRSMLSILLALVIMAGGILTMSSCATQPTPLLTLEGHTISVNHYQFLLSRVKGTLALSGYNVDSASFWDMIVDENNTTYDEYFRNTALNDARRYLAAMVIFDERGLTLPQSTIDKIDAEIETYISDAGSKADLNAELASYGINVDMLRDIYIMEAKYQYLQSSVYGAEGELLSVDTRMAYLKNHAVAFRQVLIRAFDYVYETDNNGDDVYYLPTEDGEKVNRIAYDEENGNVRLDEFGKIIVDKNGDSVYYLPNGRIAYDKVNGSRALTYDQYGEVVIQKYSSEKLAEHKEIAEEILATVESGDYAAFESLLAEFESGDEDVFVTDGELCFLYTTGDNAYDYLNDIADTLAVSDYGDVRMISSEYGYNVVMKYQIPDDAITNTAYSEWFGDLSARVIQKQFHTLCKPYMERVTVDSEAFATLPSMKNIAANYVY